MGAGAPLSGISADAAAEMRPRSHTGAGAALPARGTLVLDPEPSRMHPGVRAGRPPSPQSADGANPDADPSPNPGPDLAAAAAEAELYAAALAACIALATDPAPRVSCLGRAALRVAGCTLVPASLSSGACASICMPRTTHCLVLA